MSFLRRVVTVAHRVVITLRLSAAKQTDRTVTAHDPSAGAWMDLRRFKPLREAGATWKEIAAELGCDPRIVKSPSTDRRCRRRRRRIGTQPLLIEHLAPVVDAWLTTEITLRATVVHERLVAEHEAEHERAIRALIRSWCPDLLELTGVGPIVAASRLDRQVASGALPQTTPPLQCTPALPRSRPPRA